MDGRGRCKTQENNRRKRAKELGRYISIVKCGVGRACKTGKAMSRKMVQPRKSRNQVVSKKGEK